MPDQDPISYGTDLLTLRFDATSQAHFDRMRQQYFPPEQNLIAAHLTLFHTLPRTREIADVLEAAFGETPGFSVFVTGLRSLGRGVAYKLEAPELLSLHRRLALAFAPHLSNQDLQKFQPHIVIQNKVTRERAKSLLALLAPQFRGFDVRAEGIDLWHYRGGPWEHARFFPFKRP